MGVVTREVGCVTICLGGCSPVGFSTRVLTLLFSPYSTTHFFGISILLFVGWAPSFTLLQTVRVGGLGVCVWAGLGGGVSRDRGYRMGKGTRVKIPWARRHLPQHCVRSGG